MSYTIFKLEGCEYTMKEKVIMELDEKETTLIKIYRSLSEEKKEKFYLMILSIEKLLQHK